MIDTERAVEICGGILPAIARFPRGRLARVATYAECGKLLADRCKTDAQAEKICRSYQPRFWQSVAHFAEHVAASFGELSPQDQRAIAGHAYNCIFEPLRCGDKLIGWCGRSYPPEFIARCRALNPNQLTLHELAAIGQECMNFSSALECEVWLDVLKLAPGKRSQLDIYARREWPQFVEPEPRGARVAMCLAFEEWRKSCA